MDNNDLILQTLENKLQKELTAILHHKNADGHTFSICAETLKDSIGKVISYCGHRVIIKSVDEQSHKVNFEILLNPIETVKVTFNKPDDMEQEKYEALIKELQSDIRGQTLFTTFIDDAWEDKK